MLITLPPTLARYGPAKQDVARAALSAARATAEAAAPGAHVARVLCGRLATVLHGAAVQRMAQPQDAAGATALLEALGAACELAAHARDAARQESITKCKSDRSAAAELGCADVNTDGAVANSSEPAANVAAANAAAAAEGELRDLEERVRGCLQRVELGVCVCMCVWERGVVEIKRRRYAFYLALD